MRILVAGIGNIFHGDDAFGVEVAASLARRQLPPEVRVADFGIRGFDLAYALTDGCDAAVLVDATQRGNPPGTLYTIEIDPAAGDFAASGDMSGHGMNPVRVLQLAQTMGGCTGKVLLVGCEPESLGSEEEGRMGLTATVSACVEAAASMVEELITKLLAEEQTSPAAKEQEAPSCA